MSRAAKIEGSSPHCEQDTSLLGVISMVSIDEELGVAKALKATINTLSITTPKTAILATLRKANHTAILNLGRGGALNAARIDVGIAISNLIDGSPTPERIEKTRAAVDAWIKELEAAKG
jgi:hypothetical protein